LVLVVGMSVGTLFTLLVLPTMYSIIAVDHRAGADTPRARALAFNDEPTESAHG
jgi:hypothetical protein